MIKFYIYDSQNGKIMRSFFSTDVEAIALNLEDGEQAIEVDTTIKNPYVLDADTPAVNATLDRFEEVFKAFNALLA